MKEKILQMVDAYWKFDEAQQPMSSWHDKQYLLKALEELLQPAVIKSVCEYQKSHEAFKFFHEANYCPFCGESLK